MDVCVCVCSCVRKRSGGLHRDEETLRPCVVAVGFLQARPSVACNCHRREKAPPRHRRCCCLSRRARASVMRHTMLVSAFGAAFSVVSSLCLLWIGMGCM